MELFSLYSILPDDEAERKRVAGGGEKNELLAMDK